MADTFVNVRLSLAVAQELMIALKTADVEPLPVETKPHPTPVTPQFDARGMLLGGRKFGDWPIDPVVPEGTPNTVKLDISNDVLSLPRPDLDERAINYFVRVCDQARGSETALNAVGASMVQGLAPYFAPFGGYKADGSNWPLAASWYYHGSGATPADLAAWSAWGVAFQSTQVPVPVAVPPSQAAVSIPIMAGFTETQVSWALTYIASMGSARGKQAMWDLWNSVNGQPSFNDVIQAYSSGGTHDTPEVQGRIRAIAQEIALAAREQG